MSSSKDAVLQGLKPREPIVVVDGGDYGRAMAAAQRRRFRKSVTFVGTMARAHRAALDGFTELMIITAKELSDGDCATLARWGQLGLEIIVLVEKAPPSTCGLACMQPAQKDLGPAGRALLRAAADDLDAVRAFCREFKHGQTR